MENKWITYDDEEVEVELEIADLVFDRLMTETAELVAHINDKRRNGNYDSITDSSGASNSYLRNNNLRAGFSDITKIDTDLNFNSI